MDATAVPDTLEKWHAHLARKVARPETLSPKALAALCTQEKARYDHARKVYLGSEHVLRTEDWHDIQEQLDTLRDVNLGFRPTSRQGLLVSGPQRSGKSTIALNLLRRIDKEVREREGREQDRGFAPTIAVVAPDQATARKLWERFATYLGLTVRARENADQIAERVLGVLADLGTEVILVDEIQNLRTSSEAGTAAGSALKGFMERLPITWLWTGVNVVKPDATQRLFTGRMGEQMRGRVLTHEMTRYGIRSQEDREDWIELIKAAESLLPLVKHKPGWLAEQSWDWLHDHTGGSPGPLWDILHNAATRAIRSGDERVKPEHLSERWISAADKDHVLALASQATIKRSPRPQRRSTSQQNAAEEAG